MADVSQGGPAGSVPAEARSRAYALLAAAFRFPTPELASAVGAGEFRSGLRQALEPVLAGEGNVDWDRLGPGSQEGLAQRYMELFDVGGPEGPPCFLYEGEYGGGRTQVMEDVLRFYHFFGLRLSPSLRDRPDHLATELEFLHYLAHREAEAAGLARDDEAEAYARAGRDFLAEHAADLTAEVRRRLSGRTPSFYTALAAVADDLCRAGLGPDHGARPAGRL